jgi:2-C-methyl-D-erythritol 4-phosphate cytidylyltransferase
LLNALNSPAYYFALIPAAGASARMAANRPKQYLHLAGQSILQWSVNAFLRHELIQQVFVVVSVDDAYIEAELKPDSRLTVLPCGGATRFDSVLNGLAAMQNQVRQHDWVLVHDAARPGINPALVNRLIDKVGSDEVGGLLALPVVDTVKLQTPMLGTDKKQVATISRTGLWLAQTPQMFRYGQLGATLHHAKTHALEITDEASAIEAVGFAPVLVQGHRCNAKITYPEDLAWIEPYLLAEK